MYARVARFEGAGAEELEAAVAKIREEAGSGPPEGVPAKGFMLLSDTESGRALGVTFFDSEDDYRQGDEALNAMSPPGEGMGRRASVEKYLVAFEIEV